MVLLLLLERSKDSQNHFKKLQTHTLGHVEYWIQAYPHQYLLRYLKIGWVKYPERGKYLEWYDMGWEIIIIIIHYPLQYIADVYPVYQFSNVLVLVSLLIDL